MPISINDFRKGNFKRKADSADQHPVYLFLKKNKNKAYKVVEIAPAVKMRPTTVRGMIKTLKKKGLVEHKQPYFTFKK